MDTIGNKNHITKNLDDVPETAAPDTIGNKNHITKNNCSDNLLTMIELCVTTLVNYYPIIKNESSNLRTVKYGEELFFDFEELFNYITGIARTVLAKKELSPEQNKILFDLDFSKKNGINSFLNDRKSWKNLPGTASELVLWQYLVMLLKEWLVKEKNGISL